MSVNPAQSSSGRKIALLLGIVFLGFILWYFSTIVIYILIALILSLLGRPIMAILNKIRIYSWKPGKALVAAVTLVVLVVLIGGFLYLLAPAIVSQLSNISNYTGGEASDVIRYPLKDLEAMINSRYPQANFSLRQLIIDQIEPLLSLEVVKNTVGHIARMTVDISVGAFCVLFITFFFLQDSEMFSKWVRSLVPDEYLAQVEHAMDSIYRLQVRYIVGITVESIIKFVILFFSFWIAGLPVDTSAVASLVCALLNVIPYVGPIIGGVLALLLGVLSVPYGSQLGELLFIMTMALVIFQVIDNILLQPYIYASSVKAHPLEIFIVILMAGSLAGIFGMLLAIPTYTILRVLAKEFLSRFKVVRELTTNL